MISCKQLKLPTIILSLLCCFWGSASAEVTESGYIELSDGTGLKYTVIYPDVGGRYPVLLHYQGYNAGNDPYDTGFGALGEVALANGYAILGINTRGSGCSEGSFTPLERQWAHDGLEVLDWATQQTWSNGDTAMAGLSLPGIIQLMVASQRHPSLKAILPWSAITDIYRDVAWPGGIYNATFIGFWQTLLSQQNIANPLLESARGDTRCAAALTTPGRQANNAILDVSIRPWADDPEYSRRLLSPGEVSNIAVPALITHAWQDEALSSRSTVEYEKMSPDKTWFILGNGGHGFGLGSEFVVNEAIRFLNHFVKGEDNAFESTPKVQLLHEVAYDGTYRWKTSHQTWPVNHELAELYFSDDGRLANERPNVAGSVNYTYPLAAPSMTATVSPETENQTYKLPVTPGGSVSFTSAPLAHDLEILGPARADIWLSSTAQDTDVQISLVEVRPDGQEQFIQRGWLRASNRTMLKAENRANFPVHIHSKQTREPLVIDDPTLLSIEIWPVGHVFRSGSSLRVYIEAPLGTTGYRQLALNQTPATNTVHTGESYLSRITLPVIPDGVAHRDYSECDTVHNQPCRQNPKAVPPGVLDMRPMSTIASQARGEVIVTDKNEFQLTNTAGGTHWIRAIEITGGELLDGTIATVRIDNDVISTTAYGGKLRFEIEESSGLTVGEPKLVLLKIRSESQVSWMPSPSNVAYADTESYAGVIFPLGTAIFMIACALARRSKRYFLIAVAMGALIACESDGRRKPSISLSATDANALKITKIQAVDERGVYFDYKSTEKELD